MTYGATHLLSPLRRGIGQVPHGASDARHATLLLPVPGLLVAMQQMMEMEIEIEWAARGERRVDNGRHGLITRPLHLRDSRTVSSKRARKRPSSATARAGDAATDPEAVTAGRPNLPPHLPPNPTQGLGMPRPLQQQRSRFSHLPALLSCTRSRTVAQHNTAAKASGWEADAPQACNPDHPGANLLVGSHAHLFLAAKTHRCMSASRHVDHCISFI